MKIKVTQTHISNGEPNSNTHCPIALAIKDRTKALLADVSFDFVGFQLKDGYKCVQLPKKVQNFIRKFDTNKPVKPFEFSLKT